MRSKIEEQKMKMVRGYSSIVFLIALTSFVRESIFELISFIPLDNVDSSIVSFSERPSPVGNPNVTARATNMSNPTGMIRPNK